MEGLYLIVRHTPFWAVPVMLISLEFAYIYWLRKKKKIVAFYMSVSGFCFLMTAYYYWMGGPDKAVKPLIQIIWYLRGEI